MRLTWQTADKLRCYSRAALSMLGLRSRTIAVRGRSIDRLPAANSLLGFKRGTQPWSPTRNAMALLFRCAGRGISRTENPLSPGQGACRSVETLRDTPQTHVAEPGRLAKSQSQLTKPGREEVQAARSRLASATSRGEYMEAAMFAL